MNKNLMRIGIVAGEASGDQLAAEFMQAVKTRFPEVVFEGLAGPRMLEAGCIPIVQMDQMGVMGFHQVIFKLFYFLRLRYRVFKYFRANPPDVFVGVDFTEFNLSLAKKLKSCGIKTVLYKGPSVWAWREGRTQKIIRYIDLVLTIFPFEQRYYNTAKVNAHYVGHPLARKIPLEIDKAWFRQELNLPNNRPILALLPGSRTQELKSLARPFFEAIKKCQKENPDMIFVCAHVNEEKAELFKRLVSDDMDNLTVMHVTNKTHSVLGASDGVLVASGTATLEAMLFKKPMVVAYKVPKLYEWLLKRLLKISYISLPNLLANKPLVAEVLQEDVNPHHLAEQIQKLFHNPEYVENLKREFYELHKTLVLDSRDELIEAIEKIL